MVSVNPYALTPRFSTGLAEEIKPQSTFSDLIKAQAGYAYDPVIEYMKNTYKYWDEEDPEYDPLVDMEGYEQFKTTLIGAKNADHMADLKRGINESAKRREIMSQHGFWSHVGAGLFDPINLIALPFGGAGMARSLGGAALRVGAGTGALQSLQEGLRYPFDPLATLGESAFNIGAATVTGGVLGTLIGIPAARRAAVYNKTVKDMDETIDAISMLTADEATTLGQREARKYGNMADEEIEALKRSMPKEMALIKTDIERLEAKPKKTIDELNELENKRKGLSNRTIEFEDVRKESGLRRIEDSRLEGAAKDPYKIAESWFTDSWIYNNLTPSPIKNILQDSKVPTPVKKETIDLAGDSGVTLAAHQAGLTAGNSAYQLSKVRDGEWVRVLDTLVENYGAMTGKGKNYFMDHNFNNMKIPFSGKQGKFDQFLQEINRKYINGERGANDLENESIDAMAQFWSKWGERLESTGLIGNRDFLQQRMISKEFRLAQTNKIKEDLEAKEFAADSNRSVKIAELRAKIAELETEEAARGLTKKQLKLLKTNKSELDRLRDTDFLTKNQRDYLNALELRAAKLEEEIAEIELNVRSIEPEEVLPANEEVMFSRYWNKQAIAADRDGFFNKLYDWYRDNPFVWTKNESVAPPQRNLVDFDEKALVKRLGQHFNVKKVVTGERAVKEIKKHHPDGALGMHQYFDADKGIVYIDKAGAYKKYRRFQQALDDKAEAYKKNDAFGAKSNFASETYHHNAFMLNNSDSFKTFKDYQDFVLLHEFQHGTLKKAYKEDAVSYEMRVSEAALSFMQTEHKTLRQRSPQWIKQELPTDEESLTKRVNATIDDILEMGDTTAETVGYFGNGKSKHFRHRSLDIPNSLVFDYIINDPIAVMKAYTDRVAPRYEYAKKTGRDLTEVLDDIEDQMRLAGNTTREIQKTKKNYTVLYDRVVGSVLREPHSWDARISQVMRDAAQLNYLGSAGFSTLPDIAKIIMEHDGSTLLMALKGIGSDGRVRFNATEGRYAGQMLEMLKGANHMRMTEELSNSPFSDKTFDRYYTRHVDFVKNQFYKANLLAPFTRIFKQMDSIARSHTIIDLSVKRADGKITQQDLTYLSRYNIDEAKAKEIKQLVDDGIIQRADGDGLYLPNTENWPIGKESLRDDFRTALNSGIENTVLMGTPADKPIITDGIMYIPMNLAGKLGLPEDSVVKGYHRIESPLLGMPFQFMSYSFAALNKITAAYAQNQVKNRSVALASAMGLAYFSLYLKTPDWAWEKMEWPDRIARSFDMSGIAALYSDAFYTSMSTSISLGGPNIGMGLINPKFPPKEDIGEALSGLGGAGTSITHDFIRYGVGDFVQGNYGEGSKNIIRNLPLARLWFLKEFMNETTRDLANMGRF